MRTPIIIFLLGLSGLLLADYFNQVRPMAALKAAPNEYPEAKAFLEKVASVNDVTQSPITERTFSTGYFDIVDINPGFRVTHNPEMGREVVIRAPEASFDFLKIPSRLGGRFSPDFDRPVKINQLVEVELNLEAHGSKFLKIFLSTPPKSRSIFPPDFATKGPLSVDLLQLDQIPDHSIELNCKNLLVTAEKNLDNLLGQVGTLEFLYRGTKEAYDPELDASNLKRNETLRSQVFYEF